MKPGSDVVLKSTGRRGVISRIEEGEALVRFHYESNCWKTRRVPLSELKAFHRDRPVKLERKKRRLSRARIEELAKANGLTVRQAMDALK